MEQVIEITDEEEVTVEKKRPRFVRKQTHPHIPKETEFSDRNRANAEIKRARRRTRNIKNAFLGGFGKG